MHPVLKLHQSFSGHRPGKPGHAGHGGEYFVSAGEVVRWHDAAEAERICARGLAKKLTDGAVAELLAGGGEIIDHPLLSAAK